MLIALLGASVTGSAIAGVQMTRNGSDRLTMKKLILMGTVMMAIGVIGFLRK